MYYASVIDRKRNPRIGFQIVQHEEDMMNKSPIKFPTPYIRNRRLDLGLSQKQVCAAIGMQEWAYQKLEQRGQIPEEHIPALAKVLQVSERVLWIEKLAPMVLKVFGIPKARFEGFVTSSPKVDSRLGNTY